MSISYLIMATFFSSSDDKFLSVGTSITNRLQWPDICPGVICLCVTGLCFLLGAFHPGMANIWFQVKSPLSHLIFLHGGKFITIGDIFHRLKNHSVLNPILVPPYPLGCVEKLKNTKSNYGYSYFISP